MKPKWQFYSTEDLKIEPLKDRGEKSRIRRRRYRDAKNGALTEVACRSGASTGWLSRFRGFLPRDKGCEEIGCRNNSITPGQG